ncbi:HAD-IC family P-type ATPase [Enterococcus sp. S181_ASV_20]|nr:HAD-IC family P-type ATPase [Enterococcus sp. S181_ASV_20]
MVNIVIFCFIKFFDSLAQFLTTKTGLTKGVLLKNFYKMNSINKVGNIFFDKTGTLTNGIQEIKEVVGTKNSEEDFILMIAASALRETNYPFTEAVIRNSKKKNIDTISIDSIECKNNSGLSVYIDGINFKVGTENFFRSSNLNRFVEKKNRQRKNNNVYISKDNTLIGLIEFYDSLRKESVPTLKKLKSMGSSLTILTGDTMFNTNQFFPTRAGLCETICELSDFEKAEIIKTKNLDGNNSLMVGDGYNDIMALNVADLGIALGSSEKSVLMNADVIFVNDNLEDIFTILEMINKLKISKIFSRFLLFLLIILILFIYF